VELFLVRFPEFINYKLFHQVFFIVHHPLSVVDLRVRGIEMTQDL